MMTVGATLGTFRHVIGFETDCFIDYIRRNSPNILQGNADDVDALGVDLVTLNVVRYENTYLSQEYGGAGVRSRSSTKEVATSVLRRSTLARFSRHFRLYLPFTPVEHPNGMG